MPADVAAWDLDPAADAITGTLRLLRGARLVVSLYSAIGHLASLVDAPQLVVYLRQGDERRSLILRDGIPTAMRFGDMHRCNGRLCLPAWGGPAEIETAIAEAMDARVIAAPIAAWQGQHVATVPGWAASAIIVVRELGRSFVMRAGGNDLIETAPLAERPEPIAPAEVARRESCCHACGHYRAGSDQCGLCGCGFIVAERVASPLASCPGGHW